MKLLQERGGEFITMLPCWKEVNNGCGMRDAGYRMRDTGYRMRDTGYMTSFPVFGTGMLLTKSVSEAQPGKLPPFGMNEPVKRVVLIVLSA
jgi:hypothetical protein